MIFQFQGRVPGRLLRPGLALVLALSAPNGIAAPPANDNFADRHVLTGFPVSVSANNAYATREPGEPLHASSFQSHSLWWTWTAPFSGRIGLVVTTPFLPQAVALYTGDTLTNLAEVARQLPAGLLPLEVETGETYQIAIDASNPNTQGAFTLELIELPSNDLFRDRTTVPAEGGWLTGTTANSTHEPGEPLYAQNGWAGSVWYSWTPSVSGPAWITTLGSSFNADIYVYTGSSIFELQALMNAPPPGGALLNAVAGVTYQMSITGFHAAGPYRLGVLRAAPNDNFANRVPMQGHSFDLEGWTMLASSEPGEPGATSSPHSLHSVWWSWTAPDSGRVLIQSKPGNIAEISVFTGTNLNQLVAVPLNGGLYQAVGGQTYHIRAANPQEGGLVNFAWSLFPKPANDNFANRIPLAGSSLNVTGWNFNATREAREPQHADFNFNLEREDRYGPMRTGRSLWWSWTAPADGWVRLNPQGSDFDPVIAVYTGESIRRLQLSSLNRDLFWGNVGGVAEFPARAGTTYQIVLDGPPTGDRRRPVPAEGRLVFSIDLTTLALLKPVNGSVFVGPIDVDFKLNQPLSEVDGQLVGAQFYTRSYNQSSIPLLDSGPALEGTVTNMLPGYYLLNARATNQFGLTRVSMPAAIAIRPANDNFTNSVVLEGYYLTNSGYISAATWENGERRIAGGPPGSGTVWWSWIAPASGTAKVTIYGGSEIVSAWKGTVLRKLQRVAHSSSSELTFKARAGTRYHFSTARFGQSFFNSIGWATWLSLELKNVDLSAPATGLVLHEPASIPLAVRTTEPTNFIARVEYFAGDQLVASVSHPPFSTVWSNAAAWSHEIRAVLVKTSGERLPSDLVVVTVRPANDHFTNAFVLTGTNPIARGTAITATLEPGEPRPTGWGTGRGTAWWKWTAPASGRAIVRGSILSLKAYKGTSASNLVSVADAPGTIRFDGYLTFRAEEGETYWLAAEGGGHLEFEIELVPPPPNDDFDQRLVVSGETPTFLVHTFAATAEPGEPLHMGLAQGRSVWFSWTAPKRGSIRLYNRGFGYNMGLAVYTGSSVTNLTRIAETSQDAWFNVIAGQQYAIAVADPREAVWDVPVDITYEGSPPNDNFLQATPLDGGFHDLYFNGSILSATRETGEPAHGGALDGNSVWWSWTAPETGTIKAIVGTPTFIPRIGFYSGTNLAQLTLIALGTNQLQANVTKGTAYRLVVETANGGVGYFSFETHFNPSIVPASQASHEIEAWDAPPLSLQISSGPNTTPDTSRHIHITLHGEPGRRFVLQVSTDLVQWTDALADSFRNGQFEFVDPQPATDKQRFYRAVLIP